MIPNIFLSSTITDLHYLRDSLRDAILELQYQPVMSERGGVGYLFPTTAADSCCRAIANCQLVVLIVGKRYGDPTDSGISTTHREYRTARDANIPIITLADASVLHYKDVYDESPNQEVWKQFKQMQNPCMTFSLLDEIKASASYNAVIPFSSAADAKKALKTQIADFVGECLAGIFSPLSKQLQDIHAELVAGRLRAVEPQEGLSDTRKYLAATRYLLNDSVANYRTLLEKLFGDIDTAITRIVTAETFEDVVQLAGFTIDVVSDESMTDVMRKDVFATDLPEGVSNQTDYAHFGLGGGYAVCRNKLVRISETYFRRFEQQQKALKSKTKVA